MAPIIVDGRKWPPPLRWRADDTVPLNMFPFVVYPNRWLTTSEYIEIRQFCTDMFGPGGNIPVCLGRRWVYIGGASSKFAFVSETDLTIFVLAFTGEST